MPGDGIYPGLSSHYDVAGPITKSVRDAAIMLNVLVGKEPGRASYADGLRTGALAGKAIGLFEPGQWAGALHPAVADHYRRMVVVIEGLGARTLPMVFADTQWTAAWNARTFFATCNSYWAGVDAYLAGLGGHNPASHAALKARAGFDIGLSTTAPLFGLLSNSASNVNSDNPKMADVIRQAEQLRERYEAILAGKGIDALFVPRSLRPLPDIDADTIAYLGDQVVGTEVNEIGLRLRTGDPAATPA